MLARLIAIPFVVAALIFLYLTWEVDDRYAIYIVPWVVALAILYVLSPQVNWWWYQRYPPELDPPLRHLLERFHGFYQHLPPALKKRFRERVGLYMLAVEFMPQVMEDVPEDIKGVVASNLVTLTFGIEEEPDWRLPLFERVVVYPKPFPSPQYRDQFHASEIFPEDGVLLFSAEQLMLSFTQPTRFFNVGLYEYAKVFALQFPETNWLPLPPDIWKKIGQISGFSLDFIQRWINLPVSEIDGRAITITVFLLFPRAFQMALPELFDAYAALFYRRLTDQLVP